MMKYFIDNLKNSIDFFLRQKINFSRSNYSEKNESKDEILNDKALFEKYDLSFLKSNSTIQNYLENLYTLDLLDKYLDVKSNNPLKILDIGCKNWFYAKGEYFFFKKHCEKFELDGIEIDSNRLYSNFYTRGEVAKFYIKDLDNTRYIEKDFLKHNENYDCLIWFLPFIVEEPLLKWGLPIKYFKPEKMLEHAYNSLNKGGQLFIVNQGDTEYEVQKELCNRLSIQFEELGEVKSAFIEYEIPRFAIIIKK